MTHTLLVVDDEQGLGQIFRYNVPPLQTEESGFQNPPLVQSEFFLGREISASSYRDHNMGSVGFMLLETVVPAFDIRLFGTVDG